jgi:hypothetical protein
MTDLQSLLGRCEGAENGSRALDAEIEVAVRWDEAARAGVATEHRARWTAGSAGMVYDSHTSYSSEAVTSSLDAALMLVKRVLPGWIVANLCEWEHDKLRERGPWMAQLRPRGAPLTLPPVADCRNAPTPALAVCCALLRAKMGECEMGAESHLAESGKEG